jgi:hypothetical protein
MEHPKTFPEHPVCPSCSQPMEKGYAVTNRKGVILWAEVESTGKFFSVMNPDLERLYPNEWKGIENPRFSAARCRTCRLLLSGYRDELSFTEEELRRAYADNSY